MTMSSSQPSHDGLAVEPALDAPEPSAIKRSAKWAAGIDWDKVGTPVESTGPVEIPGLDVAALQRKYGPHTAYWPREQWGTFTAPLGATHAQFEQIKYQAIRRWLDHMDREGWQFRSEYRIQVYNGVYPAYDLRDRAPRLDLREFRVRACFVKRHPETIRLELDPELLAPFTIRN